jgi:hypothetical protein
MLAETPRCSFCQRSQQEVSELIASPKDFSPRAYICDECVKVCCALLPEMPRQTTVPPRGRSIDLASFASDYTKLDTTRRYQHRDIAGVGKLMDQRNEARHTLRHTAPETPLHPTLTN